MQQVTRFGSTTHLRAPRNAAIAGIVFSVLLITSLVLIRRSIPRDPLEASEWVRQGSGVVALAVNMVPFAGIAFIWFIGVLRDRLGDREDRLFATVFVGSAYLFLAMLFVSAGLIGGIVIAYSGRFDRPPDSTTFTVTRAIAYVIMNVYAVRMAAVFMIATCTLALRTRFVLRWIAFVGYAVALALLFAARYIEWILLLFPLWVLLLSFYILVDNFRVSSTATATGPGEKGDQ